MKRKLGLLNPGCKTWPATTLRYAGRYGSWAPEYCRHHRPCRSGDRHPFAHEPRFFSDIHSSEHRSIEYYFIVGSHGVLNMVLGLSLPTPAVYILPAVLVGPALTQAGIVPIAAHLFIFYFDMLSTITPPVCLAAFTAASLAKADPMKTGWESMRLAILAYIVLFVLLYRRLAADRSLV